MSFMRVPLAGYPHRASASSALRETTPPNGARAMNIVRTIEGVVCASALALAACSSKPATDSMGPVTDAGVGEALSEAGPHGGESDASQEQDAGADAPPYVNPLATVPRTNTWTFVPFADASCADGTATGIGVSFNSTSDNLLIYLNGGGACWDQTTCRLNCATNLTTGYDESHGTPAWNSFSEPSTFTGTLFDRNDANNPVATWNYVHVFYCTGDLHAGSRIASYTIKGRDGQMHPVHHLGYENMLVYLKALAATFHPNTVVLAGSSAGGMGSYNDYDVVARTFAPAPVYMIDDAGPYLQNAYTPAAAAAGEATAVQAWGLEQTLPSGCTDCLSDAGDAGMSALAGYLSKTYPNGRMALVSSVQDYRIRQRYDLDGGPYEVALDALATNVLEPLPNWRYFFMAGNTHTALETSFPRDTPCGLGVTSVSSPAGTTCSPTLEQFVAQEINGSPEEWSSATPPAGVPGTVVTVPDLSDCSLSQ
jgi:hypothetical protein